MNKEFTKLRKERGGESRPSFFSIIFAVAVGVLFVLACLHSDTKLKVIPVYAAEIPANSIEQTGAQSYYESDGVFHYWGDNKQKHYVALHSFPPSNTFSNITYVSYYLVNTSGERLHWRFIGYKNGAEVFRSGLAAYGEKVDINGIDIDSYDVYAVNMDDNNDIIAAGELRTAMHTWEYKYYVELPTEKQGIAEDIVTTEYVDLSDFDNVEVPTFGGFSGDEAAGYMTLIYWVFIQWRRLLAMRYIGWVFTTCFGITLILFLMRGRTS